MYCMSQHLECSIERVGTTSLWGSDKASVVSFDTRVHTSENRVKEMFQSEVIHNMSVEGSFPPCG